jgi:hypothetical protein
MRLRSVACACIVLACTPAFSGAETKSIYSNLANPSIGCNALFLGQVAPDIREPYGPRFQESEISLLSTVDPYWILWADIVFAPEGVDPEEVCATTTKIPSVQLKLGKVRASFGKHALLHVHAFPFVQAPVIVANTIGVEGLTAAGMEAAWLTPLPWFCELTGGVYQGAGADDEHPLDFGSPAHDNVPVLGHLKNVIDLGENTTVELGVSALSGKGTDKETHAAFGGDLTLRNVPLRQSNQRGWILQGEYIEKGSYPAGRYVREQHGWYASFQYRWSQVWWTGLRAEQARDSFTDVLTDSATGDAIPGRVRRASINVAWTPSEFSFIRLEYSFEKADDGDGRSSLDRRLMVQMSYTIGYHPAHAY